MAQLFPCEPTMATCKRFLLFFGLVGTLIVILSSDHFNVSPDIPLQIQKMRKQLLKEMCDSDKDVLSKRRRTLKNIHVEELRHFIVDDKHGIIYCFIPKVACTNWKKVMYVLSRNVTHLDPESSAIADIHNRNKLTYLSSLPRKDREAKLKHYTKFLFVRDPFVRLISAYRNKFLKHDDYFYRNFGRTMLKLYGKLSAPPQTEDEAFKLGIRPSFYNFIQYLLDPMTERSEPFEPHWRQMHRLCYPCLIDYDFIGHQESLDEDAKLLLKMLKLDDVIKFPHSPKNVTTSDWMLDWFRVVPLEERRKLYKIYEKDFKLFGYRKPTELLDD